MMKQSTSFAQVATNLLNVLQGYTKGIRFVAVLTMLLMLGIGQAWAADVTFTANQDKGSTTNTSADSMTKSVITISSTSAGLAYSEYRFYNGTITISSTAGNITKVEFTCTENKYVSPLANATASTGSLSASGSTVTWTGSSSSFTIRNTAQTRASKIVVTTASSTPTLTTTTSEIDFSNVAINSTNTKTFTFSGSNLTADATLAITGTNESYFSVNTTTVPPSSGSINNKSITVTYKPTATGEHTATLTISSTNAIPKTIALKGNALQEHTVKFFSGVEEVSSKNVLDGSTIGTLPSATSCDQTNYPYFIGWTEGTIDGTTTTKPTIITTSTIIKANNEYHAVFADKQPSSGTGTSGSTTFAPKGSSKSSPWSDNGSTWTFSNITFENSATSGFPKNGTATVTLPTGAVANTITITRTSNSWSSKISLLVKTGSNTIQTLTQPNTTTTINLTSANQKNTYTFSHNNAATNVAYVDNIKVNYTIPATPTIVTYITSCTTETSVTLNPNGGTGTMDAVTTKNGTLTLPKCTFTREGYTFAGWATSASGEVAFADEEVVSNWDADITELFAKWTAKTITITWDANGGSVNPTSSTYIYNGATITPPTPIRTSYTFNGWFTATTGGTEITEVGTTNKPTEDVTYYAQWTSTKTATSLSWSEDAYSATIDADNTFPELTKTPADLTGVTYSSLDASVATIDANTGEITLKAAGTTTITATFTETNTHAGSTASYTLTVNPSNCRWVETEIADIIPTDEVLITMKRADNGNTYTLDHSNFASGYPPAVAIHVNGNEATFLSLYHSNSIWNISGNATDGYILRPNGDSKNALYCTSTKYNVKVGTNNDNTFIIDGGYLKNTIHQVYVGVYNSSDWRHYPANTGNAIANQTLKFYKRECLDSEHYWVTWDAGEGTWEDKSSKKLESYQVGVTITAPTENPTREGYRFDGWDPTPENMPAENTTFTAKWTEVYKITWYENSVPSYTYVPSDNAVVTWEDNIADCGEKKFYGWTADDTFVSDPTTPPSLISKGTTIAGDVTYYAVYADAEEPANPGYTKVTTISEGTYLIAAPSKNIAYKAVTSDVPAVISNNVISSLPEGATELLVELGTNTNAGYFAISYNNNGTKTYIYGADKSLSTTNTATYDWSLDADNATLGEIQSKSKSGYYIQANNTNGDFKAYAHTQTVAYLYKKQTTTYKNFAVSCATYTISVTPPTGGTVTTNPADEAGEGQTITVNVTPADCKYLTALKYNDGSDHNINIASTPYTFTMPAADVTVTATFADKTATDIEVITSAHRMLMLRSAFVGEQVRITYNNGDKETLNWNDSRLTFTGYNTATLGSQTVTVTYNDCGTQSASYNIEVIDGLGITFWDGNYTEVVKYEPGDLVDVDSRIGKNICSGWEFAGWSETKVADESEEYVPVHNFNATDAKVLYAVYVKKKAQWTTIVTADEAKSGAKYVLAYNRYGTYYALTSSVKDVNYLAGKVVTSTEGELNSFDVYYLSAEPTADLIWELASTDENGKWYLYNKNTAKYIDLSTQGQIHLTDLPSDKLQMESGYSDSQIRIASSTVPTYYLSWDNSNTRYNTYESSNSQEYWYTKDEEFTSTPPCSPLSATFHGNGGIVTDGVNSGDDLTITEPTRDAGITTPTAYFADCNGKSWTFVGWAREEIDVTSVPVLTTDLLHDGGGNKHYDIEEDGEEFWAVFTNTGNPETKYGTITFTKENFPNTYDNTSKSCTIVENGDSYNFSYTNVAKPSGNSIQIQEGEGYLTNTTSLGKINSISFTNFRYGNINCLKVSLGTSADALTTVLTAEELQVVDGVYTYYPKANYSFFKIESIEDAGAVGIESISIDFGKGTQIWATTPDCSTITLSGDEIYVTATNGRAVMAPTTLTVKANQLEANADVILTSNSSDVYFSTDRTFNFAAGQAESQKPTTSLTLPTDAEGNLATTDVYIHYMPNSEGNGVPADVVISANLETPNPSITDDHTIHVRNLPANFVIATKVGATWYALPANMTGETNPLAEVIEVDETTMTATAPNTSTYTLWPVKTTNGTGNRYADYGDRLRFAAVNNEQRGLWANNNNNSSAIRNYAVINSLGADGLAAYEWKVTTTVVDGHWQYTLQTDQTQNQNYLRYWTSAEGTPVGPKWGTYNAGENKLYFLPVTETQPFEYAVVEWYPTKVLIQTDAAITSPTVKVNGVAVASPTLTNKGGKLYEISDLPLETNPNKLLQISFTDNAINYTNTKVVPIILSRGAKTITGEPFATLTQKVYQYADVVVRDGATLTIDGGTDVANTLLGMTIYPTAKVSVADGQKLSVHNLTFFGGIDEIYDGSAYTINKYGVPQLSLKGSLNKTVTTMDYIMRVNLDQMYQVGVPYDVNLGEITYWDGSAIKLGDELYVSAYDGQARANRESKTWIWETDFAEKVLKPGIGYTISAEPQVEGDTYSILRMPMKDNIASGSSEEAKTINVVAYDNKKGVTITDNHKGWNYLSNPYMTTISGGEADTKLVLGYLKETGTGPWEWVNDEIRYVTIPMDNGKDYYQKKFSEAELKPFKSFFVQIAQDGDLSFALASRQNAPARLLQQETTPSEIEFELLLSNATQSDNTGLLISEEYTPAYEINADLEKMMSAMSVYTIYNGYNLAYNALSPLNAKEQIPVGYIVPAEGEYTLELDPNSDLDAIKHIYLMDYDMGVTTDLINDAYTFYAADTKSDKRFAINIELSSDIENKPTGFEDVGLEGQRSYKFIYDGILYIMNNGVIYSTTGQQLNTMDK